MPQGLVDFWNGAVINFGNWVVINLTSLLPVTAALIVMAVALQTMFSSHGDCEPAKLFANTKAQTASCPHAQGADCKVELRTNPVFCPDTEIMHRLFDDAVVSAHSIAAQKPAGDQAGQSHLDSQSAARQDTDANAGKTEDEAEKEKEANAARINLRGQRALLKKDYDDAHAAKAEADTRTRDCSDKKKECLDDVRLQTDELEAARAVFRDADNAVKRAEQKPTPATTAKPTLRSHSRGGGRSPPTSSSPPTPADTAKVGNDKADADKAKVDAVKSKVEAVKGIEQARKNAIEADTKFDMAKQKLASFDNAVEIAISASLLREARARLLWFGSFGVSLVVALGTILAMTWVWLVAIDDHWRPADLTPDQWYRGKLLALVLLSLLTLYLIGHAAYWVISFLFDGQSSSWPLLAVPDGLAAFDDSLQSYVFGSDKTAKPAVLLDRGLSLLKEGNWLVIVAVIFIAVAVTAILYQHPEQVKARKEGPPAATALEALQQRLKQEATTADDAAYSEFLKTLHRHPERVAATARPADQLLATADQHLAPEVAAASAVDKNYDQFFETLHQRLSDVGATAPPADQLFATLRRNENWEQVRTAATMADNAYNGLLATLHQRLKQVAAAVAQADDAYVQFLARCFRRLSVAIYFGAVLLVVSVGRISAQYGWPAALLDPEATEQPIKTHLTEALKNVADQFAVEYGMIFTLLLLSLFLPAWVVLRRRAWEVARARKPGATQECQQKWLSSQGLAFTYPQHVAQLVALLAPAGAGIFLDALKSFTGG